MNQPLTELLFQCAQCNSTGFALGIVFSSMCATCTECHTIHRFDLSYGFALLTHVNGVKFVLGQIQESAETVPAPAPESDHLSTETVDK